MTDVIVRPDFHFVHLLAGLSSHYGRRYCYPSQDKLTELSARFYSRPLSRRTLNRHLKALEDQGWIRRQRRHTRDPRHGYMFRSTLYTLTRRAIRALQGLRPLLDLCVGDAPGKAPPRPCATNGTILVPTGQIYSGGPPGGAPPTDKKVALDYLARAKALLKRR